MPDVLALVPTGATIKPNIPTRGLINNVILTDKRRGLHPGAIIPIGTPTLTSMEEKFSLMTAVSPAIFLPIGMGKEDKPGDELYRGMSGIERYMTRHALPTLTKLLATWKKHNNTYIPHMPAMLDESQLQQEFAWNFAADDSYIYHFVNLRDWVLWLNDVAYALSHTMVPPAVEVEALGLGFFQEDGNYKRYMPHKILKFHDNYMEMKVERPGLPMRIMREGCKLYAFAAECLYQAIKKGKQANVLTDHFDLDRIDCIAYTTYFVGTYGGWNGNIKDEIQYVADETWYQGVLPWLAMGPADLYPELGYDRSKLSDPIYQEYVMWRFMFHVMTYITHQNFGARTVPIKYLWRKGNVHIIKAVIKEYFSTMPLDLGGSDDVYMQPATNRSVPNAIALPALFGRKTSEFHMITMNDEEKFTDLTVVRGEADIPELSTLLSNLRIITSRDARVQLVKFPGTPERYLKIIHRVYPAVGGVSGQYRQPDSTELLLHYLSDFTTKPKTAVWGSASWNRAAFNYTMGPVAAVELPVYGRKTAIPGGLLPTDESTRMARAESPATLGAADAPKGAPSQQGSNPPNSPPASTPPPNPESGA
jgi:hypothetical protein